MLISLNEAELLVGPIRDLLVQAHLDSWDVWAKRVSDDPEFVKPLKEAERYAILHRHIIDHVSRYIGVHGRVTERLQFFGVAVGDKILLRFKHVDAELQPRRYPTEQQVNLSAQEFTNEMIEILSLDGVTAPLTVLTVGYTLTPAEDAISRVSVICHEPKLVYSFDLYNSQGGINDVEVTPLPGVEPKKPRVVSKRAKKEGETG
jgi:hypothetical protein